MKTATVFLIGFLLSSLVIFMLANDIENGHTDTIIMYFVVYLLPALVLAFLNSLYVHVLSRLVNNVLKCIFCLIPVIVMVYFALKKDFSIEGIDGNLKFAAHVSAISLGLTNVIWLISSLKNKVAGE